MKENEQVADLRCYEDTCIASGQWSSRDPITLRPFPKSLKRNKHGFRACSALAQHHTSTKNVFGSLVSLNLATKPLRAASFNQLSPENNLQLWCGNTGDRLGGCTCRQKTTGTGEFLVAGDPGLWMNRCASSTAFCALPRSCRPLYSQLLWPRVQWPLCLGWIAIPNRCLPSHSKELGIGWTKVALRRLWWKLQSKMAFKAS